MSNLLCRAFNSLRSIAWLILGPFVFATNSQAGTFITIKDPACIGNPEFSTGEQYRDGNSGIINDQWFMLTRWQANEPDFINHSVSYDVGLFTGLHGAALQRGIAPESSGGTGAVQLSCQDAGMLINTWSSPHRPIVGGGYNDMFGYSFSSPPAAFTYNGVATDLVLQANIAVPWLYRRKGTNPDGTGTAHAGPLPSAQVGLFAYLQDVSDPSSVRVPIVIIGQTHMTNLIGIDPNTGLADYTYLLHGGGGGRDYTDADTLAAHNSGPNGSYWVPQTSGSGVCFVSAPISSQNDQSSVTKVFSDGDLSSNLSDVNNLNASLTFWRAHITPANLSHVVGLINSSDCPMKPALGYSTDPSKWVLLYAGVIAEATPLDQLYDISRSNWTGSPTLPDGVTPNPSKWADYGKDQVSFGVHIQSPGIYRYTSDTAPAVTSASATTFYTGLSGSFSPAASGVPTPTISVSGALPAGVSFTGGTLSGTPAAGTAGTYSLVVTATNELSSATQNFTLTVVSPSSPAITSASSATFVAGNTSSFTITTTGAPAPTVAVSGTLPAGISFSSGSGNGQLSGVPAAGTAGSYPLVITASNPQGTVTQNFTLTVAAVSQFVDGGFESPTTPANSYMAFPSNTGWTILGSGASGMVSNGYMASQGYPAAPEGQQIGYYQAGTGLRQVLSLTPGSYVVSFAGMGNSAYPGTTAIVSLNGTQIGSSQVQSAAWGVHTTPAFNITSANTYTFDFTATSSGAIGYVYIDRVQILPASSVAAGFADGSFESPIAPTNSYTSLPSSTGWITLGSVSGVIANGYMTQSGYPAAPDGNQLAYYSVNSGLRQSLPLGVGNYSVTFSVMANTSYPGTTAIFSFNGSQVGSVTAPAGSWNMYTTPTFAVSAGGTYNLDFTAGNTGYIYIDNVILNGPF
jgi:hypothetical protein